MTPANEAKEFARLIAFGIAITFGIMYCDCKRGRITDRFGNPDCEVAK